MIQRHVDLAPSGVGMYRVSQQEQISDVCLIRLLPRLPEVFPDAVVSKPFPVFIWQMLRSP